MGPEAELGTLRELHGGEFTAGDFISKPQPHGDLDFYWPTPEIPSHLIDPEKLSEAQKLLDEGTSIVGNWGQNESEIDSEEFQKVSSAFKDITGVSVWEIVSKARDQLGTHIANRMER